MNWCVLSFISATSCISQNISERLPHIQACTCCIQLSDTPNKVRNKLILLLQCACGARCKHGCRDASSTGACFESVCKCLRFLFEPYGLNKNCSWQCLQRRALRMTTERKLGNQSGLWKSAGLTESPREVLTLNFKVFLYDTVWQLALTSLWVSTRAALWSDILNDWNNSTPPTSTQGYTPQLPVVLFLQEVEEGSFHSKSLMS